MQVAGLIHFHVRFTSNTMPLMSECEMSMEISSLNRFPISLWLMVPPQRISGYQEGVDLGQNCEKFGSKYEEDSGLQ